IADMNVEHLQLNLIRSHACRSNERVQPRVAKSMIVLRLNALLKGFSGIRVEVVQLLQALINKNIVPVIPQQGSLGASGDLAPLAHLALVLIGEGRVFDENGDIVDCLPVLEAKNLKTIHLQAQDEMECSSG